MSIEIWMPLVIAVVTLIGSGGLVKVITDRQLRRAQTEKTANEGEVALSADYRAWFKEERDEAARRIEYAEKRMDFAEKRADEADAKADAAQVEVRQLERKVTELNDQINDLTLRLQHCPGGAVCPQRQA